MLSHENFVSNIIAAEPVIPLDPSDRVLSFLPLCHVLERIVNYLFQSYGLVIYYAENMGTIGRDLKDFKVHAFVSVPRLLESVYDKIIAKGKDLKGIKKKERHIALFYRNNK